MIVYHGTTQIIEHPDIKYSKKYLDFGPGFYLTSFEDQAKKWAFRKGLRQVKKSNKCLLPTQNWKGVL